MKHFLDLTGLTQFLAKLKTIFTEEITSSYVAPEEGQPGYDESYEDTPSGGFTYMTRDSSGNLTVPHNVTVKNVVTTDSPGGTPQTISGDKTFTGAVVVPNPTDQSADGIVANKGYVDSKILENDAMSYKGAVYPDNAPSGGIVLPLTSTNKTTYKVGATFKAAVTTGSVVPGSDPETTYGNYIVVSGETGIKAKAGDLFIVKAITGSASPYTLTYDYIPAADDVTSIRYSTTANEVNVDTTAEYGDRVFGEAAVKQVATTFDGTYNTDAANTGQLTTVKAVAEYALKEVKNATGDSTLTIGTKASGEQTLAVKIKSDSGISSDANGIYAVADTNNGISIDANGIGVIVNTNSGLSMDATNGVTLTAPGNGIEVDSTSHNIKAVGNSVKGIEITGSGISAKLAGTNGIKFDSNGKISLDLGNGLAETTTDNKLEVKIDSSNANGLSVGANGVALATATQSTAGAMSAQDKENLDNLASSTIVGKDGITVTKTGNETDITADIDITKGLTFTGATEGGKQIGVNAGNGIEFSSGAVTAKANTTAGIDVDNNGVKANLISYTQLSPDTPDPETSEIDYELFPTGVNASGQLVTKIESITIAQIDNLFNPQP